MKEAHEYYYVFSCQKEPVQIPYGTLPNSPYKKFDTWVEAADYILNRERYKHFEQPMLPTKQING